MISIKYKCPCMEDEGETFVRARGDDEDIEDFMLRVRHAIQDAHLELAPRCEVERFEYVRIPVAPDTPIGKAVP